MSVPSIAWPSRAFVDRVGDLDGVEEGLALTREVVLVDDRGDESAAGVTLEVAGLDRPRHASDVQAAAEE